LTYSCLIALDFDLNRLSLMRRVSIATDSIAKFTDLIP
jgi:hypothetical protein